MIDLKNKQILILAPHTDDETIGCGGFIHRASNNNAKIHITAFSWCYKPELIQEFKSASNALCSTGTSEILNFKVRNFDQERQAILEKMIELKKKIDPDIIICPASFDIHQDHQVICNEAVRAFKDRCILGYCHVWNVINFSNFHVKMKLNTEEIESKNQALDYYKTQCKREYFINRKNWMFEEKYELITCNM